VDNVIYILQNLSKEAFKKQYGRNKPNKDSKIIFSCLAGKRSAKMQQEMQKLGYRKYVQQYLFFFLATIRYFYSFMYFLIQFAVCIIIVEAG